MLKKVKEFFSPFHILLCSTTFSALQQSCLFQEFILPRNCSDLQHPVFSRNLDYPGTALLCSIPYFPEIYSILELLCSAAFHLFLKSRLSRKCSALEHPVFSRNLDYPGTALLCSIPSFQEIQTIQELLCSAAFRLFQKSRLSRNCSALQHPVFSRNLDYPGTALLCIILSFPGTALLCSILSFPGIYSIHGNCSAPCTILSITGIYSIQELLCSALCSIVCFPEIYSTHELLLSSAEPCRNRFNALISKLQQRRIFICTQNIQWLFYTFENLNNHRFYCCFGLKSMFFSLQYTSQRRAIFLQSYAVLL